MGRGVPGRGLEGGPPLWHPAQQAPMPPQWQQQPMPQTWQQPGTMNNMPQQPVSTLRIYGLLLNFPHNLFPSVTSNQKITVYISVATNDGAEEVVESRYAACAAAAAATTAAVGSAQG